VGHTYTNLLFHVVFSTKDRRPLIHDSFRCALAVGGTNNHVHGLLVLPADIAVADAMRKWKSVSSKWAHETFPTEADFAWQEGYAAFSVAGRTCRALRPTLRHKSSIIAR
jgi:REP element-mobilizing transposase RayT